MISNLIKYKLTRCQHNRSLSLPTDTGLVICFDCGSTQRLGEVVWYPPHIWRDEIPELTRTIAIVVPSSAKLERVNKLRELAANINDDDYWLPIEGDSR